MFPPASILQEKRDSLHAQGKLTAMNELHAEDMTNKEKQLPLLTHHHLKKLTKWIT